MSASRRSFAYDDDAAARTREGEIVASLADDGLFNDDAFPAAGASLYRDGFRAPRGHLPAEIIDWNRINQLEIRNLKEPVTFGEDMLNNNGGGTSIRQGALGNCYFLSALAQVSTKPELAKGLIVSDANRGKGIYTVKFNKNGKWLYVHVDDRIPCNRMGDTYFSRSVNPNETWVMIVEKGKKPPQPAQFVRASMYTQLILQCSTVN